ncbi:MAG: 4Fe-4S binding protein [Desulfobacter sp.]|nr:4Fe-4S binding protein [Desulfobacter sp.]WDP85301.1 MAG: 4Fe-4S binding protein [Desulfobacter sp.]
MDTAKLKIIQEARQWLVQERVDIFLGYRELCGHKIPHGYTRDNLDELEGLCVSRNRYPLEKVAIHLAKKDSDLKIGLIARDCNQRTLNVLYTWNQLDPKKVETIGVNCCPSPFKAHGDCSYLAPKTTGEYKQEHGIDYNASPESILDTMGNKDRFSRWMYEFNKCIKCYGCRNICPVCFCKECSLEHEGLIEPGRLPPEVPIFHLVRATHMAGRCIDCGLCEDACPAHIPLRLLYREANEIVSDIFDFQPGSGLDNSPFSIIGDKIEAQLKPLDA